MISRHLSPFVVLAVASLVGCTAPSESEEPSDTEAAVTTAKCPASIDIALGKPVIQSETPTRYFDGSELSATEIGRVAIGMNAARQLGELRLDLGLTTRENGKCTYEGPPEGGRSRRATLRTKGGKDILDVFYGEFRSYLFPSSYGPEGLTFQPNAKVSFMVNVNATGPFSDGASLNVEIGQSMVLRDAAVTADHAFITQVADEAGEYFWVDEDLAKTVRAVAFEELPATIHAKGQALLAEAEHDLKRSNGSAFMDDTAHAIIKDGRVVGYVISIGYAFDHPLHDGSGVRFYVDVAGEVVLDVSWTG